MSALSDIRNHVEALASEELQLAEFESWFFDFYQEAAESKDKTVLEAANKIAGLLGEASHAHWTDGDVREELATAILPFVQPDNQSFHANVGPTIELSLSRSREVRLPVKPIGPRWLWSASLSLNRLAQTA